jgi:hypothetical protein
MNDNLSALSCGRLQVATVVVELKNNEGFLRPVEKLVGKGGTPRYVVSPSLLSN